VKLNNDQNGTSLFEPKIALKLNKMYQSNQVQISPKVENIYIPYLINLKYIFSKDILTQNCITICEKSAVMAKKF